MRVLLINPPVNRMIRTVLPERVEKNRGYSPPLGLLYLAAMLRQKGAADVAILDAQAEELSPVQVRSRIAAWQPSIVGISALTFTLPDALDCATAVKESLPHVPVVLGGPHASLYAGITLRHHGCVDYILRGEGELSFSRLVEALDAGSSVETIAGLAFRSKDGIRENGNGEIVGSLDAVPFPARDLLDMDRYRSVLSEVPRVTSMITSRGCPCRCTFCYRAPYDHRFRPRSPANVVAEMAACWEMGIGEVFIYDDTFNMDRGRVFEICYELLRQGLPIGWDARCRVDLLDAGMLALMKRAGCRRLHLGVETGTARQMEKCRKGIRLDQARETFRLARQANIDTLAYFMLGFPDETEEEMLETIQFALKLPTQFAQFALVIPFPGTELYETEKRRAPFGWDPWAQFAAAADSDFEPPRCQGPVSSQRLESLFQHAYRAYYSRPSYLFQSLARIRSWDDLLQKGKVGMSILFSRNSR